MQLQLQAWRPSAADHASRPDRNGMAALPVLARQAAGRALYAACAGRVRVGIFSSNLHLPVT